MAQLKSASTSDSGSTSTTLSRGKACLRCRKRKMRCDGAKPACAQCSKAKKPEHCQYDDGKGKTRTQALREKISKLEEQICQMRDSDHSYPAIVLHDPNSQSQYSSSCSSHTGSPSSTGLSIAASPFNNFDLINSPMSPQSVWPDLRSISPSTLQLHDDDLPLEISYMLLDIFLPHKRQCGFVLHVERLRTSLSQPLSERRHPVIMNAISLWACFISRPGSLSQHEQHYLSRTLDSLNDALAQQCRIVDVIQASCLLSRYFFACGRLVEASYHSSSAATLAVHAGMHRILSAQPVLMPWNVIYDGPQALELEDAQGSVDLGERILIFWEAYVLDRCLSVALKRPVCFIDDEAYASRIDTPWPIEIEECEAMRLDSLQGDSTVKTYFNHQGQVTGAPGGFSLLALKVKAVALYEGGSRLAANWLLSGTGDFGTFELTISRFFTTLLPLHQLDAAVPDDRREFILIHTLGHAAVIQLHQRFAQDDPTSLNKCIGAARGIVALVTHIASTDYEFLDPILGTCWASAAGIFALEQGTWLSIIDNKTTTELETLMFALTKLSAHFPLTSFQVARLLQQNLNH